MIAVLPTTTEEVCSMILFTGDDTKGSDVAEKPGATRLLLTFRDSVYSIMWSDKTPPYVIKEEITPL